MITAKKLIKQYGMWGEHPEHEVEDWRYEVDCGDTRLGYWDWVVAQIEFEEQDGE